MADDSTYDLTISRSIATTPENAYHAWTDPEALSTWFTTNAVVDLRVGGRYSNADHDEGEFLAIVPNELVRFTWEQQMHQPGSTVTVTFASEEDGRTCVTLRHEALRTEQDRDGLIEGWTWAMDSLTSWLETGRAIRYAEWEESRAGRQSSSV